MTAPDQNPQQPEELTYGFDKAMGLNDPSFLADILARAERQREASDAEVAAALLARLGLDASGVLPRADGYTPVLKPMLKNPEPINYEKPKYESRYWSPETAVREEPFNINIIETDRYFDKYRENKHEIKNKPHEKDPVFEDHLIQFPERAIISFPQNEEYPKLSEEVVTTAELGGLSDEELARELLERLKRVQSTSRIGSAAFYVDLNPFDKPANEEEKELPGYSDS